MIFTKYNVRLKTGFFKTQQYTLEISKKQIILTSKEDTRSSNKVIKVSELNNVCIIKKSMNSNQIEINEYNGVYIGTLDTTCNMEKLICDLTKKLGGKFTI